MGVRFPPGAIVLCKGVPLRWHSGALSYACQQIVHRLWQEKSPDSFPLKYPTRGCEGEPVPTMPQRLSSPLLPAKWRALRPASSRKQSTIPETQRGVRTGAARAQRLHRLRRVGRSRSRVRSRQGQKAGNVSDFVSCGARLQRLVAELDKCEIRCANCTGAAPQLLRTGYVGGRGWPRVDPNGG